MILANGTLLPDSRRKDLIAHLEEEINVTRTGEPLDAETVIAAVDALGKRLRSGEFDALLAPFFPFISNSTHLDTLRHSWTELDTSGHSSTVLDTPGQSSTVLDAPGHSSTSLDGSGHSSTLSDLFGLVCRETLEYKLHAELGPELFGERRFSQTTARLLPLGTLLHVAPGNMPGLPVYTALEGLLTGNVNLIKLPRADKGLSLAALSLLTRQEPRIAPFLYAFDLPSGETEELRALARLADGVVTWGGDDAVTALRELAGPGCKLMEWGHRLSFAYVAGYEDRQSELSQLAGHIIETGGRLCSSCQVIFLDARRREEAEEFCREFLPYLEAAAARRPGLGAGAPASLSGHTALLERIVEGRTQGERLFRGRGCSLLFRPDEELELSPMEGNVLVKCLPREGLLAALRRKKGCLQTAGLLCPEEDRPALSDLLARAGVTRITRAGGMSAAFPGEAHDGEYPLRRYVRVVDVEK